MFKYKYACDVKHDVPRTYGIVGINLTLHWTSTRLFTRRRTKFTNFSFDTSLSFTRPFIIIQKNNRVRQKSNDVCVCE